MSVRIIVDSTADMRPEVKEKVEIVPLTVHFGDEEYLDGVTMDYVEFYDKLAATDVLPTSSQPSPAAFADVFEKIEAAGDSAVVITISSKLSGTCQNAAMVASDFENIYVVDSRSASIGAGVLIEYALRLVDEGKSAEEIVEELVAVRDKVKLVAVIDTLEFLLRGGRISRTAAFAGSMLSIKPLICVHDGVIDTVAKARGAKQGAKQLGIEAAKLGEVDFTKPVMVGFTGVSSENLDRFEETYGDAWRTEESTYGKAAIGSTIGVHIGPGGYAVAFFLK